MTPITGPALTADVDFTTPWNNFKTIVPGLDSVLTVLAVFGVIVIVLSLVSWMWKKRRGGGNGFPAWPILFGTFLAAPNVLIPIILTIGQWIAGILITLVDGAGGLGGA